MATKTIAELEAEVRYRYDLEGFLARHPSATVRSLLSDAYRELRERLTSDGSRLFLSPTEAVQATAGRTTGYPGTVLTASELQSFTVVDSVQVLDGSHWYPLRHMQYSDASYSEDCSVTGLPQSWALCGVSAEIDTTGTVTGQGMRILVWPSLDAARTFRVTGLRAIDDFGDTSVLMTDLGFDKFVMAQVGVIAAHRDDDVALYQARVAERELAYADLKRRAKSREPTATVRTDVRRYR